MRFRYILLAEIRKDNSVSTKLTLMKYFRYASFFLGLDFLGVFHQSFSGNSRISARVFFERFDKSNKKLMFQ